MLEDKLENARRRSASRTKKITIIFLIVIGLCGLVAAPFVFFDFYIKDTSVALHTEQEIPAPSVSYSETAREEFKEILSQHENEMTPRLQAVGVEDWSPDAFVEINELKKTAISSFSNGDYGEALDAIRLLRARTVEILAEAEHIFTESLEKASAHLADDLYEEAKLHIDKALMVEPQSAEALALQQEIDKLPALLPLLEAVRVARLENDLQKEYAFLQKVVRVAPEREGVSERLKIVADLILKQQFEAHISAGFSTLEKGHLEDARYHHREAKKLDPSRQELSVLASQLLAQEKTFRVQQAIEQADQAARRDDWHKAQISFSAALKDDPHNTIAVEGKRKADLIMRLRERFSHFVTDPYRLADTDVRDQAAKTLSEAGPVLSYSFGIKKEAENLRELMEKIDRKVSVIIRSDNKTYILVRGVGKVGVVAEKKIELKPGNYTFEGKREGYKSKLVRVLIPYDQDNYSMRVICDEPI